MKNENLVFYSTTTVNEDLEIARKALAEQKAKEDKWKEISKKLKYKRLSYNITQAEVAKAAEISIKVVQKIESDCEKVHFSNIYAYLSVVDMRGEDLLEFLIKPSGAFYKEAINRKQKRVLRSLR